MSQRKRTAQHQEVEDNDKISELQETVQQIQQTIQQLKQLMDMCLVAIGKCNKGLESLRAEQAQVVDAIKGVQQQVQSKQMAAQKDDKELTETEQVCLIACRVCWKKIDIQFTEVYQITVHSNMASGQTTYR
jgi:predicted  nucleic acid-binding Zn-ribbon protein